MYICLGGMGLISVAKPMIQNVFTNAMPALGKHFKQIGLNRKSKMRSILKRSANLRLLFTYGILIPHSFIVRVCSM